jgi:hypothetical protein
MVAYSFKGQFVDPVRSGRKRQTVRMGRNGRARHARPGEPVQLYVGMRTRNCTKIIAPDPICTAVQVIMMWFSDEHRITRISIDGTDLLPAAMLQFAIDDGFDDTREVSALEAMAEFWRVNHNKPEFFAGVVIRWEMAACG